MMNPRQWFGSYMASQTITHSRRGAPKQKPRFRLVVELLEERVVPTARAFTLNDPDFPAKQWGLNNTGQPNVFSATGGKYGMDIDMPAAWSVTTGKMTTVV